MKPSLKTHFLTFSKPLIAVAAVALLAVCARAAEVAPPAGPAAAASVAKPNPPPDTKPAADAPAPAADKLHILWTSQDKDVALKMVFMYALNAKKQGWWKEVDLIIWGPSARLTATDKEVQDSLKRMQDAGVVVRACRACADQYGVSKSLEGLGVEVKYMGQPLTGILKRGEKLVTF